MEISATFFSVQLLSCVWLFATPWTAARQASLSFTILLAVGACSNSCPLSQWCLPMISSSVIPFSSCLQSFPASGSFQWVSSSHQVAKVLEVQLWFPLGLTGLILQSKGLSRVFSNTTVQKHQVFGAQPFLWSNSHIRTRLQARGSIHTIACVWKFYALEIIPYYLLNLGSTTNIWVLVSDFKIYASRGSFEKEHTDRNIWYLGSLKQ